MGRARAKTRLSANVTEEQGWYLDSPDIRLTRIFTVVLLLHAVAIGGIIAFKMIDKASDVSGITISSRTSVRDALQTNSVVANKVTDAPAVAKPQAVAAPLRQDPSKEGQYRVQAGDKLPEIAKQLGVPAQALRQKNAIISDNELYPGRWLDIPTGNELSTVPPAAEKLAQTKAPATPSVSNYSVKKGDTAWGIARKFNVSFGELMKTNGISKPESLQIGQSLDIPASN
jgi:LysM repeat protein